MQAKVLQIIMCYLFVVYVRVIPLEMLFEDEVHSELIFWMTNSIVF
jgi:hypothetical protein